MDQLDDDRSPTAKGISTAMELIAVSILMVIPPLLGSYLDQHYGTKFVWTVVGLAIGLFALIVRLKRIAGSMSRI